MAYEFVPSHVQIVADVLDKVAGSTSDLLEAWQVLWADEDYKLLDEELRVEIDFLFAYELQEDYGNPSTVRLVEPGLSFTATRVISETPASAWTLWSDVGTIAKHPAIGAHIADALLTARVRSSPEHAASVVLLYMEAAELSQASAQQVALSLARANYIARSRGMLDELSVRAAMLRRIEALGADAATSGPALTLLTALAISPRGGDFEPGERELVRTLLFALGDAAITHVDEIGKTLIRSAEDEAEQEFAKRWHVARYLLLAQAADHGMQRMHHAQTAADLATAYGLLDLRDTAVQVMQSVDHDSMGCKTAGFNMPMSKNGFRAHLRKYRHARSWNYAFTIFLAGNSPSGDYEANVKTAERAASGSIRALISRTVYGSHGLPERTNADFMVEEITRTETIALNVSAILLALELEYVRDRFSRPQTDRIADWMVDSFSADGTLAKFFSESVTLHWDGKFSDSARMSIPLVERAARELLLALDEPLYRTQRGESPGRFPSLDFYLDALAKRDLDPNWVRAIRVTLLTPGMNLRNLSAHGFSMHFSENQSALLLRLAGLLCAMPLGPEPSGLQSPPDAARRLLRRRLGWIWS